MKPLETLRALGTGGEAPTETKQRVYGALLASLSAAAAAATIANTASVAPVPAPLVAGLGSAKALLIAGGIWLFGGAVGAALYGALHPQEVRIVYVDRRVPSPSSAAPITEAVSPATASSTATAPIVDNAAKRVALTAAPSSDLARERALLDLARSDAARGEPGSVLEQTKRHRAQFPHGKLAEEREALAIRALLSLGRSAEARSRADAFHLAYPHSFLTPVIDSALSSP